MRSEENISQLKFIVAYSLSDKGASLKSEEGWRKWSSLVATWVPVATALTCACMWKPTKKFLVYLDGGGNLFWSVKFFMGQDAGVSKSEINAHSTLLKVKCMRAFWFLKCFAFFFFSFPVMPPGCHGRKNENTKFFTSFLCWV
jgi:hypothetical protein